MTTGPSWLAAENPARFRPSWSLRSGGRAVFGRRSALPDVDGLLQRSEGPGIHSTGHQELLDHLVADRLPRSICVTVGNAST